MRAYEEFDYLCRTIKKNATMKQLVSRYVLLLLCLLGTALPACARTINLTPCPRIMNTKSGELTLPSAFAISAEGLDQAQLTEARRFATELGRTTGLQVTLQESESSSPDQQPESPILFRLHAATTAMDAEGYELSISDSGVDITAATTAGFFYAFQSLKKLLPAHVAAGVYQANDTYTLPLLSILDAPRFRYRGFMLDVSRHFFTTKEIKKFLRLMALYKMNHFHWHLTDDQGWRVEIKKYPKLTTIGATRANSWNTDLETGSYWTGQPYGPYFYTQDEIRDVVAYADSLHITVVPEVEMPGHFAAAVTAYPEYSCNPKGKHEVWVNGGISTDVLNVGNERAVQFAKDILTELAPLFPGQVFHVGGDETPTTAWQNNAECQALYKAEGMTNYSQLQSRFTKQIAEHLRSLGKRIAVWNEAVTASGANTQLIKESEATIYCWNPCQSGATTAANLGLNAIITNWGQDGCYYINRRANQADYGAGNGGDNLQKMYNYLPVPAGTPTNQQKYYHGVQGTFWCEHVSDTAHLEHLALPRLIAIAETGWTPQARKNFAQFVERMKLDTAYLRLAGFRYHPQYIDYDGPEAPVQVVLPQTSTATLRHYYQLVSIATTGGRSGRCIQLLAAGSALLAEQAGKGAAAGMLWSAPAANASAAEYAHQLWAFELDPAGSGKYALVCKAEPKGSVSPTPSAAGTNGRWSYDKSRKNYNFILADNGHGKNGDAYYYSLRSDKNAALWMNCAMNFAVNLYGNPADGQGGYWKFLLAESDDLTQVPLLRTDKPHPGSGTFDLAGRRVDSNARHMTRGIYIIDGVKTSVQ